MSKRSKKVLKNQKRVFGAIVVGVFLLTLGFGYLAVGNTDYKQRPNPKRSVDLPGDHMNPQDIWMNRVESQNRLIDQKLSYLENLVLENKKQEESAEVEKRFLKQEIAHLKTELKSVAGRSITPAIDIEDPLFGDTLTETLPDFSPLVEFSMEDPPTTIKNVAQAVPSGTSVKALLVSSVDASCGVYSINDPIPVKLRLLDDGHLPKHVDVSLKGGILIGSAYGNLSSERVYIRLERLTQVNTSGDFVETEVAGYVTGEDGKYGVRGTVVDKSGKIITNAAISGIFGEASQILQAAVGRYRIDNYLSTNQSSSYDSVLPGPLGGASNAFDMLADYYVKRAEQIEPVIQVNAGRVVDITFTHGAEIGDLHTKEKLKNIREKYRECT